MSITAEAYKKVYADGNRFYITETFNDEMRHSVLWNVTKQIGELKEKKNAELIFFISSHGGDGYLVMDLIDAFERAKKHDITVKTVVSSHAFSAGSMLAVAGTKGHRYIAKGAEHLPHYGQFDGYRKATPLQLDRNYEHNKRWNKYMLDHYKKYCEIPELEEQLKDDFLFIPSDKCLKWGLADKLTDEL